ncbi:hypothetical protein [Clostridium sp. YIM B02555]|uniref:hypothetical protein n=1 Tax=Clostridium sp. YIM B02555 TaxID=2911968 RepID=UPI001EEDE7C8|nr:hypothetical protein [Clostridium sp. YIM B02555]
MRKNYRRIKEGRIYNIWSNMKQRCTNLRNSQYKNYGGRGISVCDEWINSYSSFKEWALSNGYKDNLTIDREDNNGNYEPNNCRWVTRKVQQRNTRANVNITIDGTTKCIKEWCVFFFVNKYQREVNYFNYHNKDEKLLIERWEKRGYLDNWRR